MLFCTWPSDGNSKLTQHLTGSRHALLPQMLPDYGLNTVHHNHYMSDFETSHSYQPLFFDT